MNRRIALTLLFPLMSGTSAVAAPMRESLVSLHDQFVTTTDAEEKSRLLTRIARTAPSSSDDINALFDLFSRFADSLTRSAVMASLDRIPPSRLDLEGSFLFYLEDASPEAQLFGINGALRLRSQEALAAIRRIAKKRFSAASASEIELLSEKNVWWVQFEALSALAQMDTEASRSLLQKKSREAPQVAAIMAAHDWENVLPRIIGWSRGGRVEREMARHALKAEVGTSALRKTRKTLLETVLNPESEHELRHQLALKLGLSSREEDVAELLAEHGRAADAKTRIFLEAAIFASRSGQAIPLLESYVRDNPDPISRAGALSQLKDISAPARYRTLLEWVRKNDPEAENREEAARQLKLETPPKAP